MGVRGMWLSSPRGVTDWVHGDKDKEAVGGDWVHGYKGKGAPAGGDRMVSWDGVVDGPAPADAVASTGDS